jgi:protein-tyrosine sulfotransferase
VLTRSAEGSIRRRLGGPLFVVGVPRSGTSLLYVLLNQHPDAALMYEADLPMLWPLFLKRRSKMQWLERWNLYNESPQSHQIDIRKIPSDISDIKTATQAAYQEYASHKSADIWGCKSPNQYDALVRLANYFPNASFIIIWRDPADVCRSTIRARLQSIRFKQRDDENLIPASPHFAHGGLTFRGLLGCQALGVQRDLLRQRGIPVHELQYEELIKHPVHEMEKICRFLRIPFHASMGTLKDADSSAVPFAEHNTLVKGKNIVALQERAEVLPAKLKRKIDRYKNLWRKRELDWAMFPVSGEDNTTPSLAERVFDQLRFRFLRNWDSFVVFGYCFAPLRLLVAYRSWKKHPCVNLTWQDYVRGCLESTDSKAESTMFPLENNEVTISTHTSKAV